MISIKEQISPSVQSLLRAEFYIVAQVKAEFKDTRQPEAE